MQTKYLSYFTTYKVFLKILKIIFRDGSVSQPAHKIIFMAHGLDKTDHEN
jgi:hypothetical protein